MTSLAQHRNWIRAGVATGALVFVVMLGRAVVMTPSAEAHADATFTVLYSFEGAQTGYFPAGLIRDAAGNFYGTTGRGGASDFGTVFKLNTSGTETVLYSFTGEPADGRSPTAGLIRDAAGNFYGTTAYGGASGFGTVYKLDTTGKETVLHSFTCGTDGAGPFAGLVRDAAGNLYGTTSTCGAYGWGMVYKVDSTGKETVLHSFTGPYNDGRGPQSALMLDAAGNLYGTTTAGGASDFGTVFKLDTSNTVTLLHSFTAMADGQYPSTGLIRDAAGNFYGTTNNGGGSHNCRSSCGTVYTLDTTGAETVLYRFAGHPDGGLPNSVLLRDAAGNLYGTTFEGGASRYGTVFKLDTTGKLTVLHSFTFGTTDGASPSSRLLRDAAGNLYGTTSLGGTFGKGTVFKISR